MDERLEKALKFGNYRVTLFNQIEALKLKTKNTLKCSYNGGTFESTPDLICFCKLLIDENVTETVLLDINELPIVIENLEEFYDLIYSKYFEALNEYSLKYQKLRRARKVKDITEINE